MSLVISAVLALTLAAPHALPPQTENSEPDTTIDAATRARVIQGVLRRLEEGYVFPRTAHAMVQSVEARARRGEYDSIALRPLPTGSPRIYAPSATTCTCT